MSDDILARATRALREETAGDDASARFTRSRIMASVADERVKRRTRWAFLLPVAATFVAASAYGAATGKTHEVMLAVVHALGIHRSEVLPASHVPRRPSSGAPSARVVPAAEPAPPPAPLAPTTPPDTVAPAPPVAEAPVTAVVPAALPAPAKAPSAPAPDLAAPAPAVHPSSGAAGAGAADPSFDLYRAAHQAHFVERDYARALSGWNAYLKAAPGGALAPEARYNRALCLVRLGRTDEARVALTPFATGQYGTYRREDAEKLIAALPPPLVGP